jgi:hypothetical protein
VSNTVPFRATGPRTARGKKISSRNALQHGLYASTVVVRGVEGLEEYQRFARQVVVELDVDGALELALCERVVSALWRLRRVRRFECEQLSEAGGEAAALFKAAEEQDEIADKCRAEATATLCMIAGYHRGLVPFEKLDAVENAIIRDLGDDALCDGKLRRLVEREKPVRLQTAWAAFHETILSCIRAGAVDSQGNTWKVDASREDYAHAIRFDVMALQKKAETNAGELRAQARLKQISALVLVDDDSERGPQPARAIADVEGRLERQVSRALDDFWKHRKLRKELL